MCGIAGVIHPIDGVARAAIRRMNAAQVHRGPDDEGVFVARVGDATLALGHRRLAIQDLSPSGHQPMVNPENGDVIVYNGELYNVDALRSELAGTGATFRGRSDTEVMLLAFARWGPRCFTRFRGMYALAIYQPRDGNLLLARDPLGIKPLYVAQLRDRLVFASELQAIMGTGLVDKETDRWGLASLLAYGAVAAPRTMVKDVRVLDAGTYAQVPLSLAGAVVKHVFWSLPSLVNSETVETPVAEVLRAPVSEAVSSHLIGDVPVGMFLSSGLDSTAIATLAAHSRSGDIDTFTVSLAKRSAIDESPGAEETARRLGTRHHSVHLDERKALKLTREWLSALDQPTVDGLNTFIMARAVREQGIVVALSGLGGDEMFGGYRSFRLVPPLHRLARIAPWLSVPQRRFLARRVTAHLDNILRQKASDLVATDGTLADLYLLTRRLFSDEAMRRFGFGEAEWRQAKYLPPEVPLTSYVYQDDDWASVRALEIKLYLGNTLLRDADVCGMRHGVEIRVPLLDQQVVDTVLRWSMDGRRLQRVNKRWLADTMRGAIPRRVVQMRKQGFFLPQADWMRTSVRDEFESRIEVACSSGLLEPRAVRKTWDDFIVSRRDSGWSRAWLLGILGAWCDLRRHNSVG